MSSEATLTRREKQQRTRKSLLKAAAKVFCKRGLEGASVDEVAQAAGYTKGAFYANFKSKEELFLVMLDERYAEELERLDRILAGTHDAGEEAHAAAVDFIDFVGRDEWPKLYFQFVAHAARNDEFREELATRHRAMKARLAEILGRWKSATGHQPGLPIGTITAMMSFMADGFLVDRIVEPDLSEELYATMVGVFLRGVEALATDAEAGAAYATQPVDPPPPPS
jgi:AcrR family transcriptional regulator